MSSGLDPLTSPSINDAEFVQEPSRIRKLYSNLKCCWRQPTLRRTPDGGYVEFEDGQIEDESRHKVGTFSGVFCPVVLSMFSALVFIRMGFIIGNSGLLMTLLQFGIAYVILIFTVCSVCAISTNGAVEGGGVYFMISRSLGPEFGGAIGTLFFFANVVSSALCFSACTEGLVDNFGESGYLIKEGAWTLPGGRWWRTLYGSILAATALSISLAGAKYFARTSLAIWSTVTIVLASVILSFFIIGERQVQIPTSNTLVNTTLGPVLANYTGLSAKTFVENLWPNYGKDYSNEGSLVDFPTVFGILFSGVTGVMAGANMSGELRNPSRSIPRGTLAAIVFTGLTYITLTLLTAATCSRFLLQNNYIYMLPINIVPFLVTIGVLLATFSAGMSNMIGASRVLNALVKDNLFGSWLHWCGTSTCVVIAWAVAQIALLAGSLTAIARANCALFLLSYLAVNLACLALELAGAPNFRPSFKAFSWHSALCGLLGALAMMFIAASALAGLSLILCLCLVIALHLASPAAAAQPWGSISQALIFHQVRKYLLLLDSRKDHVKYWRPQMLLLVNEACSVPPLACFANHLKKGGLLVLGHVKRTRRLPSSTDPLVDANAPWLLLIDHLKIKAFVELCVSSNVREGACHLAHLSGLGAMKPNTVMLGFYDDIPQQNFFTMLDSPYFSKNLDEAFPVKNKSISGPCEYVAMLSDFLAMEKSVCLCRHFHNLDLIQIGSNRNIKFIDVWLSDLMCPSSGDLFSVAALFTLQLACILNTQSCWKKLKLRIMLTDNDAEPSQRSSSFRLNQGTSTSVGTSGIEAGSSSPSDMETEAAVARLAASPKPTQIRLAELLKLLRIQASIIKVNEWENIEPLRWANQQQDSPLAQRRYDLPDDYLKTVNHMIRNYSSESTGVIFMYLPPPPEPVNESKDDISPFDSPNSLHNMQEYENALQTECPDRLKYMSLLKGLTEELPPTVLVHGLKAVTSTLL